MIRICVKEIKKKEHESRREAEIRVTYECLERLGVNNKISHDFYGKPYFEEETDLNISITHSLCWCGVAVASKKDGFFGIDVESSERKQIEKVAPRVFTAKEIQDSTGDLSKLIKLWTAKEAVFKAIDKQGINFKRDILVNISLGNTACYRPSDVQLSLAFHNLPHNNIFCLASQCNKYEFRTL